MYFRSCAPLFFAVFALLTAASVACAQKTLWSVQIGAYRTADSAKVKTDSLTGQNIPAYTIVADVKGVAYHRVRIGLFAGKDVATQFALFHGVTSPYLVPGDADRESAKVTITGVRTDTIRSSTEKEPLLFARIGSSGDFAFILWSSNQGLRPVQSYTLRIHDPHRADTTIEDVTGILETSGGLQYSVARLVYMDPEGDEIENHLDEIKTFAGKIGIPADKVKGGIAGYGDDMMIQRRFPVVYDYDASKHVIRQSTAPGFDYVDKKGVRSTNTGLLYESNTLFVGNASFSPIETRQRFGLKGKGIRLYGVPLADEYPRYRILTAFLTDK